MAKLSHPAVMPVFDVGDVANGVYIVMPLITGGTLHDWIHAAKRPWRQVVDRFVAAGRGLAAAHAAGLIHRDFKPRNVLVDGDNMLVADFGIAAQAAPSPAAGGEASASQPSTISGTPAYMAPEQARGDDLDARADQYSFCVSLWEGLHGERPQQAETRTSGVLASGGAPEVPSDRRGTPAWLLSAVTRGFAPVPDRRWPSVSELIAYVERRRKRMQRIVLGAAAGAIVLLVGGAVALAIVPGRTQGAPCPDPRPRLAGVWDARVKAGIESAFAGAAPVIAADTLARIIPILDAYAETWRSRQIETCEATHVRHTQPPDLLDRRQVCLDRRLAAARSLTALFADTPPRELVVRAQDAVADLPDIADCSRTDALLAAQPLPASAAVRARIAAVDAELDAVTALKGSGRRKDHQSRAQSAVATARSLQHAPLLARSLLVLSSAEYDNSVDNEASLRELAQVAADVHDDRTVALAWIAMIETKTIRQGNLADAEALEPVAEAVVSRAGGTAELRFRLLVAEGGRAMLSGEFDLALDRYSKAEELASAPRGRAEAQQFQAKVIAQKEGPAAARPLALRVLTSYEEIHGPRHPLTAPVIEFLAQIAVMTGDFDAAEVQAKRALSIYEGVFGPDHTRIARSLQTLGYVANMRGRFTEARDLAQRGVTIAEKAGEPQQLASALGGLAQAVVRTDGFAAARPHYERGLATLEQSVGKEHPSYVRIENDLAAKLVENDDCPGAEPFLAHSIAFHESKRPDLLPMPLFLRAQCAQADDRLDDAIALMERTTALCRVHACEPAIGLSAVATLGQVLFETGRDRPRGVAMVREARAGFEAKGMTGHAKVADTWMKEHGVRRQ